MHFSSARVFSAINTMGRYSLRLALAIVTRHATKATSSVSPTLIIVGVLRVLHTFIKIAKASMRSLGTLLSVTTLVKVTINPGLFSLRGALTQTSPPVSCPMVLFKVSNAFSTILSATLSSVTTSITCLKRVPPLWQTRVFIFFGSKDNCRMAETAYSLVLLFLKVTRCVRALRTFSCLHNPILQQGSQHKFQTPAATHCFICGLSSKSSAIVVKSSSNPVHSHNVEEILGSNDKLIIACIPSTRAS
mmetsp:Transcript_16974/g.33810  ORF Transcript_16974/g.33810 Transcript_16974/m.33810 type:complete len:247 (-) Transcript_16974:781-1521(-)